jgi:hypothetical protein
MTNTTCYDNNPDPLAPIAEAFKEMRREIVEDRTKGVNYPRCCCGSHDVSDMDFRHNDRVHRALGGCCTADSVHIEALEKLCLWLIAKKV